MGAAVSLRAVAVGLGWVGLVAGGFAALSAHQFTPGRADPAPGSYPAADRPTLLLFLHPHCPCAPATVRNLGPVLERHPAGVTVYVVAEALDSENGRLAATLPGAEVVPDPGGATARRFGARTSGHVVVYGRDGKLAFAGGVTAGRGHAGDNPGLAAGRAALAGEPGPAAAPVFGCPLADGD
jgi:hypothetical protein